MRRVLLILLLFIVTGCARANLTVVTSNEAPTPTSPPIWPTDAPLLPIEVGNTSVVVETELSESEQRLVDLYRRVNPAVVSLDVVVDQSANLPPGHPRLLQMAQVVRVQGFCMMIRDIS